jgi:hypothetical protein
MLICKNDKKKKYKGTEPSPKGLGYCAHAEKEGKKRKGKDGNTWIIKKVSNGSLRWIKIRDTHQIKKQLHNKIYKWWLKLSEGEFIIIYKNKKYKNIKSNKKTHIAKSKDITTKLIELGKNKDVEAIIWSAMSIDILDNFINYLIYKISKKELKKILNLKKTKEYFINNYKKYFTKNKLQTNKDYVFKSFLKK